MECFKPGDWVTWAFVPRDEGGPFNEHWRKYISRGFRGTVENRLLRYEPPPYLVLRVILPTEDRRVNGQIINGDPYALGLELTRKKEWGGSRTDMRHFAAEYFMKVPEEMVERLRREYERVGDEIHLKYKPPR